MKFLIELKQNRSKILKKNSYQHIIRVYYVNENDLIIQNYRP